MECSIRFVGRRVEVSVARSRVDAPRLLSALRGCRDGSCGCSAPLPAEIGSMAASASNDNVILELSPRRGVAFNRARVLHCVECCLEKARLPPRQAAS
ncbi:MAG: hypothetical protein OEY97_03350 [Nitrospirota bacterium]|nr:hypothetical protein [Nitrospirota bacterium]